MTTTIDVGGRTVRFSNPDKVLWPATGTTKRDLLEYYLAVAAVLLPHLANRPLTLGRWPDGTGELGWLQTTCHHHPEWIPTHPVPRRRGTGPGRDYCLVNEEAALVWVVNLAAIELHPLLACVPDTTQPTSVMFDLDPGPDVSLRACCVVALRIRDALAAQGLEGFPKTSGAAGLHVVVPIRPGHTYAQTKAFARAAAARLTREDPSLVVDRMERARRQGRIFIDWSQNDERKSTVAPYSARAMTWPTVSTPLRWDEVEEGAVGDRPLVFGLDAVVRRLESMGDLFRPVLGLDQALPASSA
jgi:bifunctional non-homologous end joining protein LigD